MKKPAQRQTEIKTTMLAREFMVGAFSAVAGDAIARQVHSPGIESMVHHMGLEPSGQLLFPLAFVILFLIIRVPIMIKHLVCRKKRTRRVHHVIVRSNYDLS